MVLTGGAAAQRTSDHESGKMLEGFSEKKADPVGQGVGLIGSSRAIREVFTLIERVADTDSTVIIYGDTGTGKELVARAIFQNSNFMNRAFVPINCGAIPENLLESELFGHVRGAFTGATSSKAGKFELANEGTLFLDEIGDMSLQLQVKLLRVLEQMEIERVGGNTPKKVNVRVIAATHRDLSEMVQNGSFREDLFYRLHVIPIHLPQLSERRSDIPQLVSHFIDKCAREKGRKVEGISEEAVEMMKRYSWPGNIRELKNVIERLVVLRGQGLIEAKDLPEKIKGAEGNIQVQVPEVEVTQEGMSFNTAVSEFEKALILQSLEKSEWVKNRAAKLLDLKRTTLVEKIKKYNISECAV